MRYILIAFLPGGLIVLAVLIARRLQQRHAHDPIDALITKPRVVFAGHDEGLEKAARLRRAQADAIKADARRLETRDDKRSKLYVVNR